MFIRRSERAAVATCLGAMTARINELESKLAAATAKETEETEALPSQPVRPFGFIGTAPQTIIVTGKLA